MSTLCQQNQATLNRGVQRHPGDAKGVTEILWEQK